MAGSTPRQTVTSRAVRHFLRENRLTQRELGAKLGIGQTAVSARLAGELRWSADDLDVLAQLGVDLPPLGAVPEAVA